MSTHYRGGRYTVYRSPRRSVRRVKYLRSRKQTLMRRVAITTCLTIIILYFATTVYLHA